MKLYHYTDKDSYRAIRSDGYIKPSTAVSRGHKGPGGRFGAGVYMTTMNPNDFSKEDIAKSIKKKMSKTDKCLKLDIPEHHSKLKRSEGESWIFDGTIWLDEFECDDYELSAVKSVRLDPQFDWEWSPPIKRASPHDFESDGGDLSSGKSVAVVGAVIGVAALSVGSVIINSLKPEDSGNEVKETATREEKGTEKLDTINNDVKKAIASKASQSKDDLEEYFEFLREEYSMMAMATLAGISALLWKTCPIALPILSAITFRLVARNPSESSFHPGEELRKVITSYDMAMMYCRKEEPPTSFLGRCFAWFCADDGKLSNYEHKVEISTHLYGLLHVAKIVLPTRVEGIEHKYYWIGAIGWYFYGLHVSSVKT